MSRCQLITRSGEIELDDEVLTTHRAALATLEAGSSTAPHQRLCYAATHLVLHDTYEVCTHSLAHKGSAQEIAHYIDWDGTMLLRRRLDGLGLGIAEAMDTAQRFDIGWRNASELIRRTGELGLAQGFVAGAGVDHLPEIRGVEDLIDGVAWQARFIQEQGGIPILLPMPWLSQQGCDEDSYVHVYRAIVDQLEGPLFVHWLGEMFLPSLAGYFPGRSFSRIMAHAPDKVRGAKLSMLDEGLEVLVRRELLARDQILLTGDDFHFAGLIAGDAPTAPTRSTRIAGHEVSLGDFSHALLGILDAIAEPAALALRFLRYGDRDRYLAIMQPCETLSRHLFEEPTCHYKAGLAFLSWLNGTQSNRMLVNHEEHARSPEHYARATHLASRAGVLTNAALAHHLLSHPNAL